MTSLNPVFTVGDQIGESLQLHAGMNARAARQRAIEMLQQVGIPAPERRVDEYPHQLSGGMRQRVMIAMALACRPDILIADEPTTALDVTVQAQIFDLLRELQREKGTAIMLITHDMGAVAEMADRVMVMYAGRVIEQGTTEQVLSEPGHPYTRGLIDCLPELGSSAAYDDDAREDLAEIAGRGAFDLGAGHGLRLSRTLPARDGTLRLRSAADVRDARQCGRWRAARRGLLAACRSARPTRKRGRMTFIGKTDTLLSVDDLKVHFPRGKAGWGRTPEVVKAVDGVSFEVRRGSTLAVVGESGSGKTTTALAVMRLSPVTSGRMRLGDTDLGALQGEALRQARTRMQIIFQDPFSSLNPRERAGAAVRAPLDLMRVGTAGRTHAPRGRAVRGGGPAARAAASVSAPVLGRAAPTHQHRAGAGHQPGAGGVRRTCVGTRHRHSRANTEPARTTATRAGPDLSLHLARHGGGGAHLRRHRGDVPRPDRRARAAAQLLRAAAAPVQRGADVGRAHGKRRRRRAANRIKLSGDPPSPINPPQGCRFAGRCPVAEPACAVELPPLREVAPDHWVRCRRVDVVDGLPRPPLRFPYRHEHQQHHRLPRPQDHHHEPDAAARHSRGGARRPCAGRRRAGGHSGLGPLHARRALCRQGADARPRRRPLPPEGRQHVGLDVPRLVRPP